VPGNRAQLCLVAWQCLGQSNAGWVTALQSIWTVQVMDFWTVRLYKSWACCWMLIDKLRSRKMTCNCTCKVIADAVLKSTGCACGSTCPHVHLCNVWGKGYPEMPVTNLMRVTGWSGIVCPDRIQDLGHPCRQTSLSDLIESHRFGKGTRIIWPSGWCDS
jgi:hypothetical protein